MLKQSKCVGTLLYLYSEVIRLAPLHVDLWQQLVVDPPHDAVVQRRVPGDGLVALDAARGSQVRNEEVHVSDDALLPGFLDVRFLKYMYDEAFM